ncbi:MAG: L-fucose:H+ symporter permease [Candidatus Acidiferrum sp.]
MSIHVHNSKSTAKRPGLFQGPGGKSLLVTFVLVTTLFLLWGFCNGMLDILNKHFQTTLHINKFQSGFVQTANYLAYFLLAIPAGLLARKFGYKGGIIIGLVLIASGAFWFVPATRIGTYWAFLTGVFVVGAGMACLETIANPYSTVLGPAESSATRINIAQTCNGLGWILGPIVGGHFVFSKVNGADSNGSLYIPYLGTGIVVAVLIGIFALAYIPDLHAEEQVDAEAERKTKTPLWRRWHFILGVLAQFLYVGAQAGIFSFFINYVLENAHGVTAGQASSWLGMFGFGLFMVGRLCGSAVVSVTRPDRALAAYAVANVVLCGIVMVGGKVGLYALFGTFFFMSIMFPTIFALGIRGLGEYTKFGSSLIVMSIIGGAIAPPLMGHIADVSSMRVGFVIPLVCFGLVALYGAFWRILESRYQAVATGTRYATHGR